MARRSVVPSIRTRRSDAPSLSHHPHDERDEAGALAERTANGPLIDLFVMDGFVVCGRRSPSTKPLIVKEEKTETIVSIDGSDIEIVAERECPSIRMMLMRVVR